MSCTSHRTTVDHHRRRGTRRPAPLPRWEQDRRHASCTVNSLAQHLERGSGDEDLHVAGGDDHGVDVALADQPAIERDRCARPLVDRVHQGLHALFEGDHVEVARQLIRRAPERQQSGVERGCRRQRGRHVSVVGRRRDGVGAGVGLAAGPTRHRQQQQCRDQRHQHEHDDRTGAAGAAARSGSVGLMPRGAPDVGRSGRGGRARRPRDHRSG